MLDLFEYRLPFKNPFRTGSSIFTERLGVLLRYRQNEIDITGEAAPLPGFSKESLEDVRISLTRHRDDIVKYLDSVDSLEHLDHLPGHEFFSYPSIRFSLSFMTLAILADKQAQSVTELFGRDEPNHVKINDVIGHMPSPELKRSIHRSIQAGFKVIKLKAPDPPIDLVPVLESVQREFPDILFRLDANRSWPLSSIEANSSLFKELPVQYIEEPARIQNLKEFHQLQEQSHLPLAIDESIKDLEDLQWVLSEYPDLYIVIKPMLMGNVAKLRETIHQKRSSFKGVVITSSLESAVGRSMVRAVTPLLGDQELSHGLNTGPLFSKDLIPDRQVWQNVRSASSEEPTYRYFNKFDKSLLKPL